LAVVFYEVVLTIVERVRARFCLTFWCCNLRVEAEKLAVLRIRVRKVRVPKTPTPGIDLAEVAAKGKCRWRFEEEVAHIKCRDARVDRSQVAADDCRFGMSDAESRKDPYDANIEVK